MSVFCVYHRVDLDGQCSAAIVRRKYPDAIMVPYNYGDDIDLKQFIGHKVIMVDCALQPFERMVELAYLMSTELIWIDHHKTAIEEHEKLYGEGDARAPYTAALKVGQAGCELTWGYFFPDEPMPRAVRLLGRYDVWDLSFDYDVLPFQFGMRQFSGNPDMGLWDQLFSDGARKPLEEIIKEGVVILEYVDSWNKSACKSAFEATLDGLKCICLNVPRANSQVFESVWDKEKYDAMVAFHNGANKHWTVTLYTDKEGIDVGAIAKEHGGGGHLKAAGFQCDRLPTCLTPHLQ
jgi:oligoribonuclease NrnB/cAMP/cGMP phosphodiesterase (DHH superfamily)